MTRNHPNVANWITFVSPCPRPNNANVLLLIWTYVLKHDGTKKARGVCNGSHNQFGFVTLVPTYATDLEQSGARTFWDLSALLKYIVIGADVTNAYAEAPPPKFPLYVTSDESFSEW